ncbi:helix-turn-helix transcriptional regulator [Ensifer sp. IC3342]|nr:helix-turn-helix transcriptional regulator [Ensifer sp. BRP08]MCA1445974.1 helix-turn-helix transcriptional regulator [Ensifer sp. IC3342]
MRSYNQFCPIAKAAEIFCERWTALILRDLAFGATRFSELQRGVPLASPTLLSSRLKKLEAEGVIVRSVSDDGRGSTYRLTHAGKEFVPIIMALGQWGQRWSRRTLAEHEIDLGLLLWALQKGAHPELFGTERVLIQFELTDQADNKRYWWFLNQDGTCELCLKPPDRDAQLYVIVSLVDLTRIWRGDLPFASALHHGSIEVDGSARLRKLFPLWLGISPLAHIRSERREPSATA